MKKGNSITITADGGTDSDEIYKFSDIVTLANTYGETFAGATVALQGDIGSTSSGYAGDPILNFQGKFTGYKDADSNYTITIAPGSITPVYGETGNGYLYYELYEANKYKFSYGLFDSVTNGGIVENLNVVYQDNISDDHTSSTSATNPGNKYTYYGGIVGCLDGGTISNCKVSGTIVQYNRVGGVVGTVLSGTINKCNVTASVYSFTSTDSEYSYASGIAAYAGNAEPNVNLVNVTNCTVSGSTIQSDGYAGGIVTRITNGIKEFNIDGTTIQNVTVKTTAETEQIGAVCGGLYILDGLKGTVSVSNVTVTGRKASSWWWYNTGTANPTKSSTEYNSSTDSSKTIIIGYYAKDTSITTYSNLTVTMSS